MSDKPFDASVGAHNRYTRPDASAADVQVVVEGAPRVGRVLGRNGPRVQVRFEMDGSTYVRWFDATDVVED